MLQKLIADLNAPNEMKRASISISFMNQGKALGKI